MGSTISMPQSSASSWQNGPNRSLWNARLVSVTRSSCSRAARDQVRVSMSEVQRRVGGEHVEVAAALDVGDPGALGVGDHDGQGMVVVRAVAVDEPDQVRGRGLCLGERDRYVVDIVVTGHPRHPLNPLGGVTDGRRGPRRHATAPVRRMRPPNVGWWSDERPGSRCDGWRARVALAEPTPGGRHQGSACRSPVVPRAGPQLTEVPAPPAPIRRAVGTRDGRPPS